jgi:hypothetical protein
VNPGSNSIVNNQTQQHGLGVATADVKNEGHIRRSPIAHAAHARRKKKVGGKESKNWGRCRKADFRKRSSGRHRGRCALAHAAALVATLVAARGHGRRSRKGSAAAAQQRTEVALGGVPHHQVLHEVYSDVNACVMHRKRGSQRASGARGEHGSIQAGANAV